ncbi:unnamed protein product [Echinostoma caproni]|uniref:CCR4-NOT transcription complex subunit 10 n=1 Tax=Echinostoma caproni TaxID=27848 RepID=A0A3P8LBI0_9TREM|nr:unnamed protein product [Echinostoma caproni]
MTYLSSLTIANTLNASGHTAPTGALTTATSGPRHWNTQTSHMLHGIRLPLQIFYIRACLLTGRVAEANDELQIVHSERNHANRPIIVSSEVTGNERAGQETGNSEPADSGIAEPLNGSELTGPETTSSGADDGGQSQSPNPDTLLNGLTDASWDVGRCQECASPSSLAIIIVLKGNFADALRRLSDIPPSTRAPIETGQCESTLVWNNLALVHHRAGQYNLSGLQLRRALRETDKTIRDAIPQSRGNSKSSNKSSGYLPSNEQYLVDQIPLHAFSLSPHLVLLHNFGLQLLFSRKPTTAFATLLQLVHTYPRNPRLWLRLAECCIRVHRSVTTGISVL